MAEDLLSRFNDENQWFKTRHRVIAIGYNRLQKLPNWIIIVIMHFFEIIAK